MISVKDVDAEIWTFLVGNWLAASSAELGYLPEVRFETAGGTTLPDASKFWARFSTKEISHKLHSHLGCTDDATKARFLGVGNLFVQVFGPAYDPTALSKCVTLCGLVRARLAVNKTPNGIWFRDSKIVTQPQEQKMVNATFVCVYEYDEIF